MLTILGGCLLYYCNIFLFEIFKIKIGGNNALVKIFKNI